MFALAKRTLIISVLFVLLVAMVAPTLAQSQPVGVVITGSLNVRSGPGLEYSAIFTLPQGFGVNLIARNEAANWVYISQTNGQAGWVNVNYIATQYRIFDLPVGETLAGSPIIPTATVTGQVQLFVYAQPSDQSTVVGTLSIGQTVELLGRNFNSVWAQIRAGGLSGWVLSSEISTSVPVRNINPTDGSVAVPLPSVPAAPTFPDGSQGGFANSYIVQPGDTLAVIAARFDVDLFALAAANRIVNINLIYAGQQLIVP